LLVQVALVVLLPHQHRHKTELVLVFQPTTQVRLAVEVVVALKYLDAMEALVVEEAHHLVLLVLVERVTLHLLHHHKVLMVVVLLPILVALMVLVEAVVVEEHLALLEVLPLEQLLVTVEMEHHLL
jgi:hypothetical protein